MGQGPGDGRHEVESLDSGRIAPLFDIIRRFTFAPILDDYMEHPP